MKKKLFLVVVELVQTADAKCPMDTVHLNYYFSFSKINQLIAGTHTS